jgi:hypothetical protein
MRLPIKVLKAALAVTCLAVAACGGNGSADAPSSSDSHAVAASIKDAAASTASPNGTTIPAATQIIDSGGNVWAVSGGVIYENGALAGYSNAVTLLLYDSNTIYQENSAGSWWSWNGSTWLATGDPREVPSLDGTTIPAATQITDGSGNVWIVSGGVIYENGALAGYSNAVTLLLYDTSIIYQENSAGNWWSWNGSTWVAAASDPRAVASPSGTNIPAVAQITDSSGDVWTVSGGVIYENGAPAGYSNEATLLLYDNNIIYQENSAGSWWSWNGSSWVATSDPTGGAEAPTISGSPPTSDVAGQAYSFVPTTTNPGGGTLSFSITNLPTWASFSTVSGALTGTPTNAQAGSYSNIVISVSNGSASASLAAFSITVTGNATLSWTAPTQNTDGTPLTNLAGYTIYYGTSASALTQTIQVASPSATSYVVSGLSSGTYYFAIAAYTTVGTQSAQTAAVSDTIP